MRKQKFFRGQRVKITDKMPSYMQHFHRDMEAIVRHSYDDVYTGGGNGPPQYSLLLLHKDRKPSSSAWYEQNQLSLVSDDRVAGEEILQTNKRC